LPLFEEWIIGEESAACKPNVVIGKGAPSWQISETDSAIMLASAIPGWLAWSAIPVHEGAG
jgi:hypothetical protein